MDMLVLGGTRLMGKHLVNALLEKGHRITVATRGITEDDFGDRVTRVVVDRCSKESLKDNIPDVLYDVVFDDLAYCSNDVKHLLDIVKCKSTCRYRQHPSTLHCMTIRRKRNLMAEKRRFCIAAEVILNMTR